MPVFEYYCRGCGENFELLIRADSDGSRCPVCGGDKLKKKFSVFGVKSGARFESSAGSSCSGCSSHNCSGCGH